ncbi:MAG: ferrochelatase [Anaerolineae bacterium]|nr:ferrochelatase [Anaerolineae bacterium]
MKYLKWFTLIVLSILLGVLLVQYMTIHPLQMGLVLFLTLVVLFVIIILIAKGFQGKQLPIAIILSIVLFVSGYAVMTQIFLSREDPRFVPELTRALGDPGDGHTAVIYFTHGEPSTYNPISWINQFKEFDEQGIAFIPFLVRPYFVHQLRNAYLRVGQSHHRDMHLQMLQSLEAAYRQEGDETTKFYISFLDDEPRPDAAVIQALNDGASHIVVSEVFLTISNHTAEGEHQIESVNVEDYGATLTFTGPMWDSEGLRSMFVKRANANIDGTDKSKVGVLLVGHGQPDEWDVEWPTETEQETSFRQEVLNLFAEDGYDPDNLSLAWMSFKEPKPAEKVEEFYENGIEKLVFYSAAISADSIHSQYDIPELVYEADIPKDIPIINLGAWNNDPIVIAAIKEKIDEAMAASGK